MPVPKRKTSKSRRDKRQSCKFIRPGFLVQCSHCKRDLLAHQACAGCGFYKGRKIFVTKADRMASKLAQAVQDSKRPSYSVGEEEGNQS